MIESASPGQDSDYDRGVALDPKNARGFNGRGDVYRRKGEFDRAIADYDQAIALRPNYDAAIAGRKLAYQGKNPSQPDNKTGGSGSGNAITHFDVGTFHLNRKDYDRAIAEYDEAIRLNPQYAFAFNSRGFAYQ